MGRQCRRIMPDHPSQPPARPPVRPAARKGADPAPDARQERLARALRDNLKKRKVQQRQRAGSDTGRDGGA